VLEPAGRLRRERRLQQPPGPRLGVGRELRSALECLRLGGDAAATARRLGRSLQRRRDLLVRPVGGRGEVPGAPVGLGRGRRERRVRCPAIRGPRELVDGRPGERVAELEPLRHEEPGGTRVCERRGVEPVRLERRPERLGVSGVARRDE